MKTILQTILIMVFSLSLANAQTTSALSPNSITSVQDDGAYGPTLIICSNKDGTYEKSVTKYFGIKKNTSNQIGDYGYKIVRVGGTAPAVTTGYQALPHYNYLNEAINAYLGWYFKRIIILAGDYEVNGSIILDKADASIGNITIEGEGFGTRIKNATSYTTGNIFEVRSYYNTIKNLSIISNNTNTCLAITTASSTVDPRHNVFENLYMGVQTMVSNDNAVAGRKGIVIDSNNKQVGFNRFKNITFNSVDKGIELQGSLRLHDNHFENLVFENTGIGVDFVSGVLTYDNIFDNLTIQADSYTKNLVNNISGRHNTFNALNHNDWNSSTVGQSGHSFVTIASTAEHTTIQNSEVGRGTIIYLTDNGKYTQLINNYGGNSDVTYKLGNNTNTDNASAVSKVEVLGEFVSSHDGNNQITAKNGRTIIGNINPTLLTGITALPEDYKLIVNGKVRVRNEVYVKQDGLTWPDYVFAKDYKLMSLQEVEQHINEKGHLPNMPSATEVEKDGIAVGDLIKRQQEKIEELTLYLIEMKKQNDEIQKELKAIKANQKL
jgi:hypothetical protein